MFEKATKKQSRLRLALVGPSGSGKTYSALAIASGLGKRIAVIDTERGSASKYAGVFTFDTGELDTCHPQKYIDAIHEAERAGYDVLIIDSLSHAWVGREGALELVDNAAKRSKAQNSFTAWREITPLHNALLDSIMASPLHVIATLRTKTEYALEKDERTGKTVPRRIGLGPVQRDGVEYEFDVLADLDLENTLTVTKTRCPELTGNVTRRPGADFGRLLANWLSAGTTSPHRDDGENNAAFGTLQPVEQVKVLIEKAGSDRELRALLPLIVALPGPDQAKLRQVYAVKKEALAHAAHRQ